MTRTIRRELRFPRPPDAVWRALTDAAVLAQWMYPNDFEARVGHRFTFRVPPNPMLGDGLVVRCEVLSCVPPRELEFTWVVGELDTRVRYSLEPDGEGTVVRFEHAGFVPDPAFAGAGYGWETMHRQLGAVLRGIARELQGEGQLIQCQIGLQRLCIKRK